MSTKKRLLWVLAITALALSVAGILSLSSVSAFESYHDPNTNDTEYCTT